MFNHDCLSMLFEAVHEPGLPVEMKLNPETKSPERRILEGLLVLPDSIIFRHWLWKKR